MIVRLVWIEFFFMVFIFVIKELCVVFVVGCDSMLFNFSGVYVFFFMCNLLILIDSVGYIGVGEVFGGEKICQMLEDVCNLVVG